MEQLSYRLDFLWFLDLSLDLASRRVVGGKKGAGVLKEGRPGEVKNLAGGGNWLCQLIFRLWHPSAAF
jgi:hypothetical protein